ncbi:MAG: hypothetical protein QW505_05745 [Thermoplasmata archaeon]
MAEFEEEREERHPLKRVQAYIPDFRGYSRKEDLRDADRMIRMMLSQKLMLARRNIEDSMGKLEEALLYEDVDSLTSLLNMLKRIESEIAYADSGLSWLASDISLGEEELERLYEFDAKLLDIATLILKKTEETKTASSAGNRPVIKSSFIDLRTKLTVLEDTYRKRMLSLNKIG